MTHITIKKQQNSIVEVVAEGHSGYGIAGEDIVCAGISAIINTTLLGLLQVAGVNVKYSANEETTNVRFTLPSDMDEQQRHDADVILSTMLCGIKSIYTEYSDFIELEVI